MNIKVASALNYIKPLNQHFSLTQLGMMDTQDIRKIEVRIMKCVTNTSIGFTCFPEFNPKNPLCVREVKKECNVCKECKNRAKAANKQQQLRNLVVEGE